MGQNHPAEYLAESILNPNRVLIEGPGFTGPDGLSKMPEYADTMTLRQLIDLVAYLKSLTTGGPDQGGHPSSGARKPEGTMRPNGSNGEHRTKTH